MPSSPRRPFFILLSPFGLALRDGADQLQAKLAAEPEHLVVGEGGHVEEEHLAGPPLLPEVRQAREVDEVAQVEPGVLRDAELRVVEFLFCFILRRDNNCCQSLWSVWGGGG